MVKRRWLWMLLAGLGLLGWPAGSAAQFSFGVRAAGDGSSKSYRPSAPKRDSFAERFGLPIGDPEEILAQRLLLLELAGQMQKKGVQPEHLDLLLQRYPNFPKDLEGIEFKRLPQPLAGMLQGMDRADLQKKFGSINLEALKKQLGGNAAGEGPGRAPMGTRPAVDGSPPEVPKPSRPPGREGSPSEQASPAAPVASFAPADEAQQGGAGDPFARRLLDWADRLQKLDPSLKNSPALSQAIQGLSRYAGGEDERWEKMASATRNAGERLSQWSRNVGWDRLAPHERLRWPRGLARPSMPRLHLPDVGATLGNRTSLDVPRVGRPAGPGGEGWSILAGAAAVLLLGAITWKMWGRWHGIGAQDGSAAWKPGPWPVEPFAVTTPQELILAFEHLSVLCLGTAARNWNHRAIAASLAWGNSGTPINGPRAAHPTDFSSERHRAADELADLYEHARYAPPSDALPEGALLAARRDLCLLAGTHVV